MPYSVEIKIGERINSRHEVIPGKEPIRISHANLSVVVVSHATRYLREILSVTVETKKRDRTLLIGTYEGLRWGLNSRKFLPEEIDVFLRDEEKCFRTWKVGDNSVTATIIAVKPRESGPRHKRS